MALNIGELVVRLKANTAEFTNGLGRVRQSLNSLESSFQSIAVKSGVAFAAGGLALGKLVSEASDAQETLSKVGAVFGDLGDDVVAWSKINSKALNTSESDLQDFAASMQSILAPTVQNKEAATQMSVSLVELATDLASINNMKVDDAFVSLRSGILGATEPMDRFGVDVRDAALNAFALEQGLKKTTKEMSSGEKAILRYQKIMKDTALAQGDARRTGNDFAGVAKGIGAGLSNLTGAIGAAVLPAFTEMGRVIRDALFVLQDLNPEVIKFVAFSVAGATAVAGFGVAIATAGLSVTAMANAFAFLKGLKLVAFLGGLTKATALLSIKFIAIGAAVSALLFGLGLLANIVGRVSTAVGRMSDVIVKGLDFGALAKSLKDALAKMKSGNILDAMASVGSALKKSLAGGFGKNLAETLAKETSGIMDGVVGETVDQFKDMGTQAGSFFADAFAPAIDAIKEKMKELEKFLFAGGGGGEGAFKDLKNLVNDLFGLGPSKKTRPEEGKAPATADQVALDFAAQLGPAGEAVQSFTQALASGIDPATATAMAIGALLLKSEEFRGAMDELNKTIQPFIEELGKVAAPLLRSLGSVVKILDMLLPQFRVMVKLMQLLADAIEFVLGKTVGLLKKAGGFFGGLLRKIPGVGKAMDWVKGKLGFGAEAAEEHADALNQATSAIRNAITRIRDVGAGQTGGIFRNALSNLEESLARELEKLALMDPAQAASLARAFDADLQRAFDAAIAEFGIGAVMGGSPEALASIIPTVKRYLDQVEGLTSNTEDLADATKKATQGLINVPQGFKIGLERFRATLPATGGIPFETIDAIFDVSGAEEISGVGPGARNIHIENFNVNAADDPETTATFLMELIDRENFLTFGTVQPITTILSNSSRPIS